MTHGYFDCPLRMVKNGLKVGFVPSWDQDELPVCPPANVLKGDKITDLTEKDYQVNG